MAGNIEASSVLLFSKCGEYLITTIPGGRFDGVGAEFRLLVYKLSSKNFFATSVNVGSFGNKVATSVQTREYCVYISGYTPEGRVFARRWDLVNPAIMEEQYLGSIPECYVRSHLYKHTKLLFSEQRIRAALLTTSDWENHSRYKFSRSQSGRLLKQIFSSLKESYQITIFSDHYHSGTLEADRGRNGRRSLDCSAMLKPLKSKDRVS